MIAVIEMHSRFTVTVAGQLSGCGRGCVKREYPILTTNKSTRYAQQLVCGVRADAIWNATLSSLSILKLRMRLKGSDFT